MDNKFFKHLTYIHILAIVYASLTAVFQCIAACYSYPPNLEGIKLPAELIMSSKQADDLSEPTQLPLIENLLVIFLAPDGTHHYGLVECKLYDKNTYRIYDCKTHTYELISSDNIRSLNLLVQFTYQPHPPPRYLARIIESFINDNIIGPRPPFLQSCIIPNSGKIIVIGDLHGNSKALRHILGRLYLKKIINKAGILTPDSYMIFTGDLADRGPWGPEVWAQILQLKKFNPDQIFVTRGNHETISCAQTGEFFKQMLNITGISKESLLFLLQQLFAKMPHGLLLGVAPEPRHDPYNAPYHFLCFCHGGIDPIVNFKYLIQKTIQHHKKTGRPDIISYHFPYQNPDASGLLWTDFCSNLYSNEPAIRRNSVRGDVVHLFNMSAILDFFDEHISNHPNHPYILDAMIRGHQHIVGLGRLNKTSPIQDFDWNMLDSEKPEPIEPSSVYTCCSSTKWLFGASYETETHAEITFNKDIRQWQITSNSCFRVPKAYSSNI